MNTLYIQPLFAPDMRRFKLNMDSLISMSEYCKKYNYNLPVLFGGWVADEFWNEMVSFIKSNFPNIVGLSRFERNYGKAIVVNKLYEFVKEKKLNFKYILHADSDIIFPLETPEMIERLEYAAEQSISFTKKPFGLIAPLQLEGNCHLSCCYENKYTYSFKSYNEVMVHPTNPSGIAGSCWFTSSEAWELVKGYRVLGVYAGDDAYYLLDIGTRGYSYQVSDSISVIHPREKDDAYSKWKAMVCPRDSWGGQVKHNINNIINEADQFWANNKKS